MKNKLIIFGLITLAAMIGFSFTACDDNGGNPGGDPAVLHGSWYSAQWAETFTFNVEAGTFTKLQDDGTGERGTCVFTTHGFTTTIVEALKDPGGQWIPFNDPKSPTEYRPYTIVDNDTILIWEHVYTRVP